MKSILLIVLLLGGEWFARAAETLEQDFQAALLVEEARRDLYAAIRAYEAIVARVDADRAIAATSVFRLGECYRKAGRTNEAVAQYQRLLRDYPGETALVRISRENLTVLGGGAGGVGATNAVVVGEGEAADAPLELEAREIQRLRALFDRSPDLLDSPIEDQTPLYRAAAKGQLSVVKALLGWGADPNRRSGAETALHAAAAAGHRAVVQALLEAKADPNPSGLDGRTPLSVAVWQGYTAVMETLLSAGVRPDQDPDNLALYAAVDSGRTNLIERLVKAGAHVNVVRAPEKQGTPYRSRTPLEHAVRTGRRGASQTLIRLGAQTLGQGDEQRHPLSAAIFSRSPRAEVEWVRELLAAAPGKGFPDGLLDRILFRVLENNVGEDYVRLLLSAGASVEARSANGTPLVCMAAWVPTSTGALEAILAGKPDLQATEPGSWRTALHFAVERRATNLVSLLLKAGADPNRLDREDRTPLSLVQLWLDDTLRNLPADSDQSPTFTPALRSGTTAVPSPTPARVMMARGASGPVFQSLENYRQIEAMLLAAGGRADIVRRLGVHARRGALTKQIVRQNAEDPPPTLADLLMLALAFQDGTYVWADLEGIRVARLNPDGVSERSLTPPAGWWKNAQGCDWNMPLEWGDIVEIPDTDRVRNEVWQGVPEPAGEALRRCSTRVVKLKVKDRVRELELRPARLSGETVVNMHIQTVEGTPTPAEPRVEMRSCLLGTVLNVAPGVRSSSDLTRVRVVRPSSGQTWVLNVAKDPRAIRFWLMHGDEIEIPEKTAP